MKFTVPVECSTCRCSFPTNGYADNDFPTAICPRCNQHIHVLAPLSISIVADRLLYRSKYEIESNDYTMSVICSAIAVECAFSSAFVKWKGVDYNLLNDSQATQNEHANWDEEYKKKTRGAFKQSADFVSQFLTGEQYDTFISGCLEANSKNNSLFVTAGLLQYKDKLQAAYVEKELSQRRNRIMHWGEVAYGSSDAMSAFIAATGSISVLRIMDQHRLRKLEEGFQAVRQRTGDLRR